MFLYNKGISKALEKQMKLQGKFKSRAVKITPESLDDLWGLSTVIETGDIARGKTIRKITIGDKNTEKAKVTKKPMFLEIKVEKIDFSENTLKILGSITSGPEDIPLGSHHSFNLIENHTIEIEKDWLNFQSNKLLELEKKQSSTVICCLFNREEAIFGKLERNFFKKTSELKGNVAKKDYDQNSSNFFEEIKNKISEMNTRHEPTSIIFGSSNFWVNSMKKELDTTDFNKKCIFCTVDSINDSGFAELVLKEEVKTALQNSDASVDASLVEEIFKRISKEEAVSYGIKDSANAANLGAVETLICTDNLIAELREKDKFKELENIFRIVEKSQGKVHIMSGESIAIKKLDGLGGVAATLRFKI